MPKIDERVAALEAKLKQIKAVQNRQAAKARSVALNRSRREEMRRKFLVGLWFWRRWRRGKLKRRLSRPGSTRRWRRQKIEACLG